MKNKSRILIIAPDYPPSRGGVEKFVSQLANFLSKQKYEIRILCGSRVAHQLREVCIEKSNEILIIRIPTFGFFGIDFPRKISSYFMIWREIRKADIIHLNDVRVFFTSAILGKLFFKKKLVLVSHGLIFHTKRHRFFKSLYAFYFTQMLKHCADAVVANGSIDQSYFQKKKLPSQLIELGIELDLYLKVVRKPIKGNFLYFGRIDQNKNLLNLLRSLNDFRRFDDDFKLRLCGVGSEGEVLLLKNEIDTLSLNEKVDLLGHVSDQQLLSFLSEAEFVMLPSLFESFGYAFVESLAAGCTLIAQNNEQFSNMIGGSDAAFLINFCESEQLYHVVNKARKDYLPVRTDALKLANQYDVSRMLKLNELVLEKVVSL